MKKESAIVLTAGMLESPFAKTCHGLLRGTDRFEVLAIIDDKSSGQDAGQVMEGRSNGIVVVDSVESFLQSTAHVPKYAVIGVATPGGYLPVSLRNELLFAIQQGMSIVNGLHTFLSEDEEFKDLAATHGVDLIDVRKPRHRKELKFWTGEIFEINIPKIAVLGTDCAIGKRTTCRFITEMCNENGVKTEMIYTGQTGWMQGSKHGFIFDSTVNDFISGEIERAIVECARQSNPQLILVEGQSALLNPTGPCGSEFILSGDVKGVVLQHIPGRAHYEDTNVPLAPIEKEIQLIQLLGAEVLGITLNEQGMIPEKVEEYRANLEEVLKIPVMLPLKEGVVRLLPVIRDFMSRSV